METTTWFDAPTTPPIVNPSFSENFGSSRESSQQPAPRCPEHRSCWSTTVSPSSRASIAGISIESSTSITSFAGSLDAAAALGAACTEWGCRSRVLPSPPQDGTMPSHPCSTGACMNGTMSHQHSRGTAPEGFQTAIPVRATTSTTAIASNETKAPCPLLLPRCLNTWLFASGCESNTDAECFCKSEGVVEGVMGCIDSWAQSASDRQTAKLCLQGICVEHISENPAIITAGQRLANPQSNAPGLLCPNDPASREMSQPICTTVTYQSPAASSIEHTPAVPNRSYEATPFDDARTTLTIPLIHLGTSTVTHSRPSLTALEPTVFSSSPLPATPTWGPFTYRPGNASHGNSNGVSSHSGTGSSFVQTVTPFKGDGTKLDGRIIAVGLGVIGVSGVLGYL